MTDPSPDIRILRGRPDDVEFDAVVIALVTALRARRAAEPPLATVSWLRGPVLVPPAAWIAGLSAA